MCERLSECKNKTYDKEEDDLLTKQDYKLLLMNVIKSQEKLKKQVNELLQNNNLSRKKIDVIKWINNNIIVQNNLSLNLNNLEISPAELSFIFDNNLLEGFVKIFENNFQNNDSSIRCFDIKKNEFIIFKDNIWEYCDMDYFTFIINTIHKKILNSFYKWKEQHKDQLTNEKFSLLFNQNSAKVLQSDMNNFITKVKPRLYMCLKEKFKDIYEYDYV
tara:strand:+ start:22410 stop:23060 length:651 start_codon:yes stop_codon:yes gene_type:complete